MTITREQKNARLEALADEFWLTNDADERLWIGTQMEEIIAVNIVRGDEGLVLSRFIRFMNLDFQPAQEDGRPDLWRGNLSGRFDDGNELLVTLYENDLLSAKEMADADREASYKWTAKISIEGDPFWLEYTEGDVTLWEVK